MLDHTFYLWDDTDEVTRSLCGICGDDPANHPEPAPATTAAEGSQEP